jgi:phosphoglycolate phosphatase-like HAD superfamily hydrolase
LGESSRWHGKVARGKVRGAMQLRAAIFDFDGTIADTFEEVVAILNKLSAEFGYRAAASAEVDELRGMSARDVARRLGVRWHKLPAIVTRARGELSHRMANIQPFEGIAAAIAELRAQGLLVGLLTSNNRRNVDLFLAEHPIAFDFVSTGSGLWSKHRRLAKIMRQHRLSRDQTAYVGDEVRDIEAARALGMRAVAVAWGYTKADLLSAQNPDVVVPSVAELVGALDRLPALH